MIEGIPTLNIGSSDAREALVVIESLNVAYTLNGQPLRAVRDVSLDLRPGEIVGIVGESGCGKSTLGLALLRLLPKGTRVEGRVLFRGQDILSLESETSLRDIRGQHIGMVFQDPYTSLNPTFTVSSQMRAVYQAHRSGRTDRRTIENRATEVLTRVGMPDARDRLDLFPHQFSGGMRQRIALAMTLMLDPELIVADEATSALDVTLEAQVLEVLRDLRAERGTAILFISHDLGVVASLCDRVVVMYAGRVVEAGDVRSVYERPLHPYTRALLGAIPVASKRGRRLVGISGLVPSLTNTTVGCAFADRCSHVETACRTGEPRLIPVDGRLVRCVKYECVQSGFTLRADPTAEHPAATAHVTAKRSRFPEVDDRPLIRLEDLSVYFHEERGIAGRFLARHGEPIRAVDGVSLDISRGEIFGLVGESGSGKTTLGRAIAGLVGATSGRVLHRDADIAGLGRGERRQLRRQVQMIFQDPYSSLSPRFKVSELLLEGYEIHNVPARERLSVASLLEMVELSPEQAGKYPHELSGGQARRVGIARAIALRPEVIVADEPTSGLDVSAAATVLNLMKDLAIELGLTYIVITHSISTVGYMADRIGVMYAGQLVEIGPAEEVLDGPAHPYTYALMSAVSTPDITAKGQTDRVVLQGDVPSPKRPPTGCRFHTRCPLAAAQCSTTVPPLENVGTDHMVSCHFWRQLQAEGMRRG